MSFLTLIDIKRKMITDPQNPILTSQNARRDFPTNYDFFHRLFFPYIVEKEDELIKNNQTLSNVMNGHTYDCLHPKSGLQGKLRRCAVRASKNKPRIHMYISNLRDIMGEYGCDHLALQDEIRRVLDPESGYEIPEELIRYLKTLNLSGDIESFGWIILLTLFGPEYVRFLWELWVEPSAVRLNFRQISDYKIEYYPDDFSAACSCGKEETVINLQKRDDVLSMKLDFMPMGVIRGEVPDWASATIMLKPKDYSAYREFVFDVCSPDESVTDLQLELKSNQEQWMRSRTRVRDIESGWKHMEIDITSMDTEIIQHIEEISFVIKCTFFRDWEELRGHIELRYIRFEQ